jgi:hypothetical protein
VTGDFLPDAARAVVPEAKITAYLLSEAHPDGRAKAGFFLAHGFTADAWELLADALRAHCVQHPAQRKKESSFGARYVVDGKLRSPDGRAPLVRSVWFIDDGGGAPRLVTAYPSPAGVTR